MTQEYEQFMIAAGDYAKFKRRFDSFCEMCVEELNNNEYVPGVLVKHDGGASMNLTVFDHEFIVRFRLGMIGNEAHGVLAAYRHNEGEKDDFLWHTYFDGRGNVMTTPNARFESSNLNEKDFMKKIVGEISSKHFADLAKDFALQSAVKLPLSGV